MNNAQQTDYNGSEIAIIGMAGRFPGAANLEQFWDLLRDGVESIAFLSDAELLAAGADPRDLADPQYVKAAAMLDQIESFDAAFFGYTPREAELIDPQQRIFLECAWAALEDAGYNPGRTGAAVGVFAGTKTNTYLFTLAARRDLIASIDFLQLVLGGDSALLSTRISYKLDLKGPSYAVQTACSTSLVAVHLACQSLLLGECGMALAGAVALNVPHVAGYMHQPGGILSPDGHCRPFDAAAAGTIFGSGVGVVVLKRLEDALNDGDQVHAIIKGTATNNDGAVKASFTAPSVEGQAAVIIDALACAGVEADTISYLEAHGTGTALGDPIEILALTEAYSASTARKGFCAIGSVKSNLGHLDAAAGMASLLKTVLALEHRQIPPTLHYRTPNPQIDFPNSPFYVNTTLRDWATGGWPRRAGVSSFGFGGTNAHIILEEAPQVEPRVEPARAWHLLPLSARTPAALDRASAQLRDHLERHPEQPLADIAYTLQLGRRAFEYRRVVICFGEPRTKNQEPRTKNQEPRTKNQEPRTENRELYIGAAYKEAIAALDTLDPEHVITDYRQPERPVVFMFSGQGAQYAGMGRGLYESEPVFRAALDHCADLLHAHLGLDVRDVLYVDDRRPTTPSTSRLLSLSKGRAGDDRRPEGAHPLTRSPAHLLNEGSGQWSVVGGRELDQTWLAQPALFAIEYALAQQWMDWGVRPAALIGHSVGELVAACLAGVFSLEDALMLVAARGRLMQVLPAGAMLAVQLSQAEVLPFLGADLALAAVNSPSQCVVAGTPAAIAALEDRLSERGIQARRLPTSYAFHSPMVEPAIEPFAALLRGIPLHEPSIPLISNLHGTWVRAGEVTRPDYWARHLREPVRFSAGIATLLREPARVYLEIGPGTTLSTYARQHAPQAVVAASMRHPRDRRADSAVLLAALGRLWAAGVDIDWAQLHAGEQPRRVSLPAYPFERQRYWIDTSTPAEGPAAQRSYPRKQPAVADWLYRPVWQPAGAPSSTPTPAAHWLLFGDSSTLSMQLAESLAQAGHALTVVVAGDHFGPMNVHSETMNAHSYRIDPHRPEDYDGLLAALDSPPQKIIHLWSLAPAPGPTHDERLERGFYSLLYLAQALGQRPAIPLDLTIVTYGCHAVTGAEGLEPANATIGGLALVIPQEYPHITCRTIDIEPASADAARLLAEVSADRGEPAIAYCGAQRWLQAFEPLAPEPGATPRLRQGGVYLIAGGLGSLGMSIASYLAHQARAKLVLLGRSGLPDRESDNPVNPVNPVEKRSAEVRALEALGAEVLVLSADLADPAAIRAAIAEARARFGTIHGVVHAAGPARGEAFQAIRATGPEVCQAHFAPKVAGLRVLEEAVRDLELDFCLLCCSLASVLGGLGNGAYAAASLFMDCFAEQQRQRGRPWISVDWDSWHRGEPAGAGIGATLVDLAIAPEEGAQALDHILSLASPARVVVSTGDLQARIEQWVRLDALRGATLARPARLPAFDQPDLESRIAAVWQSVLGRPSVGLNDNFFDLGGDSLTGMRLIAELKRALDVQIAPVTLFEAPTVAALARYLAREQGESAPRPLPAAAAEQPRMQDRGHDIAIIGMAGRFPGAGDIAAFWRNLRDGVETITFFTDAELAAAGVEPALLRDPRYVKARPILEHVEDFDAAFFGYSPREAELMDPQHRVLLECAWEALEDAGYADPEGRGAVGIYAGASLSTYLLNLYAHPELARSVDPLQIIIGNASDSLTTSISYKLDLAGPSVAVQTFCSTSLVAVHLACQSLRRSECEIALAGGVSIAVPQVSGYRHNEDGITSPDGHCRTFARDAAGTLFGNGAGLLALKPLHKALADGDQIYAVIRGSAVNNDGALKAGYTAPSVDRQADAIAAALADAGIGPETIGYLEAHGTGTKLGDPIEILALSKAFAGAERCAIGSVKTNIGHLDRAAGVAAAIKAVLALKHRQIPPSLHFDAPNPAIDFAHSPFYVNTTLADWPSPGTPRRAGVSALGFGGTNAHIILEEAPSLAGSGPSRPWHLLALSAKSAPALERMTANLAACLKERPGENLADLAYTLQVGRKPFDHRRVILCRAPDDAVASLETLDPQRVWSGTPAGRRDVVFLFPGQGAQYPGMGRDLYEHEPVFRAALDRCAELLQPHLEVDLREVLYPQEQRTKNKEQTDQNREPRTENREPEYALATVNPGLSWVEGSQLLTLNSQLLTLDQTWLAQPALFAVEYALAQQWMAWGVRPRAMIGHSLGEFVAACLAGVFSLEDALMLVAARGRLMQALPGGAMLAVRLPEHETLPLLDDRLALAAVNAPNQCVVAGPDPAIAGLERRLAVRGVECRRLPAAHAFHSPAMDAIVQPFAEIVSRIRLNAPALPYISCVTGTWIDARQATDPDYWAAHLRQTVRFAEGMTAVTVQSALLLEVGPGRGLASLARQQPAQGGERIVLASMRRAGDTQPDQAVLLAALGQVWLAGVPVDWAGLYAGERRRRVALPTYPFERQRYWIEAGPPSVARAEQLPTEHLPVAQWYQPAWKRVGLPRSPAQRDRVDRRTWLIFADSWGIGRAIAQRLAQRDQAAIMVLAGEPPGILDATTYTIAAHKPSGYRCLFEQLRARGELPDGIVYGWSLALQAAHDNGNAGAAHLRGFSRLLMLAQAVARSGVEQPVALWALANAAHDITGEEDLQPLQAPIVAACRAITRAHPEIICRVLDVAPSEHSIGQIAEQIVQELHAGPPDLLAAYRGRNRWVPAFEPLDHDLPVTPAITAGGAYLVANGLSERGYHFAERLASTAGARLALLEPRPFPERPDWDRWLNPAEAPPAALLELAAQKMTALDFPAERWHALIARHERRLERDLERPPAGLEAAVDQLCAGLIAAYFAESLDTSPGRAYDEPTLLATLRILPKFTKFFRYMLAVLEADRIIARTGDRLYFTGYAGDPQALAEAIRASYPGNGDTLWALEHCAKHYRQALSGEIEAISVLYPNGSSAMLAKITEDQSKYSNTPIYTEIIAEIIRAAGTHAHGRKLRILEIGAGDGKLTWGLVELLADQNIEYHFTDLGKSFLVNAEKKARESGYPWMRFGILDITKNLASQGFDSYAFDMIVALDVVHATPNVAETLANLGKLLAPGGIMLILEPTRPQRWVSLIWGLAEGWWYFSDSDLRQLSPLLAPQTWERVLGEQPFAATAVYPQDDQQRQAADHSLLVIQQPATLDSADYRHWITALAQREQAGIQQKIVKARALEQAGAEVLVLAADPHNQALVRAAIAQATQQFGAPRGAIYVPSAAGAEGKPAATLDPEETQRRVQAGIDELLIFDDALRGQALDFALLVAGVSHQDALAAAAGGLFMDAFAQACRKAGALPWMSMHWDAAAAPRDSTGNAHSSAATLAIGAFDFHNRLQYLLSLADASHAIVSARYLEDNPRQWNDIEWIRAEQQGARDLPAPHARPQLSSEYVAPQGEIELIIAGIWEELLGISSPGLHDNFFELGGDSLIATQLGARLRDRLELDISLRSFFDAPTIAHLAQIIAEMRAQNEEQHKLEILSFINQLSEEQLAEEIVKRNLI